MINSKKVIKLVFVHDSVTPAPKSQKFNDMLEQVDKYFMWYSGLMTMWVKDTTDQLKPVARNDFLYGL